MLLSASTDKTVRLWDIESRTCLNVFTHSNYGEKDVKLINLLVSTTFRISERIMGMTIHVAVTCVQFNPMDEQYFISGSLDGKVRIWNIPRQIGRAHV